MAGEGGMTPDERDRLARLETKVEGMEKWLQSIDGKQDELLQAAHMGKGAWLAILKIGGVMVILAGAVAWIVDKVWK